MCLHPKIVWPSWLLAVPKELAAYKDWKLRSLIAYIQALHEGLEEKWHGNLSSVHKALHFLPLNKNKSKRKTRVDVFHQIFGSLSGWERQMK
ncbi:hypothetical protein QN277_020957 [Acacia crassicarpa]|uniref:Uncharacterized protein n=1 Tax=Acacia crassicarpa TaxID=499986 RepID=A0AAE1MLJ3_9FABA|nr:hypothetical protein QN277_020957 [Acacia crassicarpa]